MSKDNKHKEDNLELTHKELKALRIAKRIVGYILCAPYVFLVKLNKIGKLMIANSKRK